MFSDLGLVSSATAATSAVSLLICEAYRLGYSVVAANYSADAPLKPKDTNKFSPVAVAQSQAADPRGFDVVSALSATVSQRRKNNAAPESVSSVVPKPLVQLSRITIRAGALRSVGDLYPGNPTLRGYDLVAVAPGEVEVLRHLVTAGAGAGVADIVQLDLSSGRLPFPLRPDLVKAVLAAGMVFEVEYAPALRDTGRRRYFTANLRDLLRLTRGRGMLLTSGAAAALELRSPADAAALAGLAGMSREAAAAAQTAGAAAALRHAEARIAAAAAGVGSAASGSSAGAAGAGFALAGVLGLGAAGAAPVGSKRKSAVGAALAAGAVAMLHVLDAPIALPRGVAARAEEGGAAAAAAAVAASSDTESVGPCKRPRSDGTSAARSAAGDISDEGSGSERDLGGNLTLAPHNDVGDALQGGSGAVSAAHALDGGAGQRGKTKVGKGKHRRAQQVQGKHIRRVTLMASQRDLLRAMAPSATAASSGGGGSSASTGAGSGDKAKSSSRGPLPWLATLGGRGMVLVESAAAAPASSSTAVPDRSWAVPLGP